MYDNYWQAAAAHDAEIERLFAPWNQDDVEQQPTRCDWCNAECEAEVCDPCFVANAEACGDWDEESIAAQRRLTPDPSTC